VKQVIPVVSQLYKSKLNLEVLGNKIFGLDVWWVRLGKQSNTHPATHSFTPLAGEGNKIN